MSFLGLPQDSWPVFSDDTINFHPWYLAELIGGSVQRTHGIQRNTRPWYCEKSCISRFVINSLIEFHQHWSEPGIVSIFIFEVGRCEFRATVEKPKSYVNSFIINYNNQMVAVDVQSRNVQVALDMYEFWQHIIYFAACYSMFLFHTLISYQISSLNCPLFPSKWKCKSSQKLSLSM